jgi:hypothetical protein
VQRAANQSSPPEAASTDIGTPNIEMEEFMQSRSLVARSLAAGELVTEVLHARIIFGSIVGMSIMRISRKKGVDAREPLLLVDIPIYQPLEFGVFKGRFFFVCNEISRLEVLAQENWTRFNPGQMKFRID